MTTPLRQRRRAAATREILDAAGDHIASHGPAGLSLRAVARSLGMTVQALYHYFPSRDELVTALITEAYHDLADAVQAALDATAAPERHRFVVAAEGYRTWAVENVSRFQLLYGTPLPHYRAPADGRTTDGARRLGSVLIRELFAGCTDDQLARADFPTLSTEMRTRFDELPPESMAALPPPAVAVFISSWGHMHGLVVLEAFGHTSFIAPVQAELFRESMRNLVTDMHRRIPQAQ
ncbi:TetR/AcrR family transcriptional regulator [Saccharopolyspora gloriosae]|uniref:TetR/AcrR family transcriptional regulator n=1 Tax=Saccharopolyspora gloriosae TaxID=455344 RepID=UPI001FB7EA4B|nr:TetR/AcrR family transcriptional regulator [Saccharopolyspora gloriosae]